MSAQHQWLQARLTRICASLGYSAFPEDWTTRADVYVPDASFCIEVQRWNTAFEKRTLARHRNGAKGVLWLVTDEAPQQAQRAMFRTPAAKVVVHAAGNHHHRLQPWIHAEEGRAAILSVLATVARLDPATTTLQTGYHDCRTFLNEVLDGRRRWYPPGTPGLPRRTSGAWVLQDDLAAALERSAELRRAETTRLTEPPAVAPSTLFAVPPLEPAPIPTGARPGAEPTAATSLHLEGIDERLPNLTADPSQSPSDPPQGSQRTRWSRLIDWFRR